jgi:hypothetical protein
MTQMPTEKMPLDTSDVTYEQCLWYVNKRMADGVVFFRVPGPDAIARGVHVDDAAPGSVGTMHLAGSGEDFLDAQVDVPGGGLELIEVGAVGVLTPEEAAMALYRGESIEYRTLEQAD